LIADITDKTYNKEKSKSNKGLALYSNKPKNNKKSKGKKKAIASISIIATLARNISKKTTSVRTQRNGKNKRKNITRNS
jgi:hypothetical protein